MVSHGLFSKVPGLGMYNTNFFIADVIQTLSDTKTTFSRGDVTKVKSKQLSEFGSWTSVFARKFCERFVQK